MPRKYSKPEPDQDTSSVTYIYKKTSIIQYIYPDEFPRFQRSDFMFPR